MKPLAFALTWLICAAASAADWPQAACTPQRTGRSPETLATPEGAPWVLSWSKKFWPDRVHNGVQAIVAAGRVYVGSKDGTVWCLNEADGKEVWKTTGLGCICNTLAHVEGRVIAASLDGVHGLDATSGTKVWALRQRGGFTVAPLVAEGRLFLGSRLGTFFCVNPVDGKVSWQFATGSYVLQSAAYDDGKLFFATEDLHMHSLDAKSGQEVWKSGPFSSQSFVHFYPVLHKGYVIFRGMFTQATIGDAEFGVAPLTADGGWGPEGKRAIAMIPQLRELLARGKSLPPEFDAAGEKIVDVLRKHPWHQDMWVLDAKTGKEAFVVPHFPGIGSLGLGGPLAPPAVDRDGCLVYQVCFAGHPFGRLNLDQRKIVDVLFHPYQDKPTGQGNTDEYRSPSTAGDLVFLVHEGENEAATFSGGVFDLRSRSWWSKPRSHPGTGSWFEHVGAAASVANGRFYHLSYNSLECWKVVAKSTGR